MRETCMGLHLRFGLLGLLLVGVGIIVLLLRSDPASIGDDTQYYDLLLGGLGLALLAAVAGYVLALRRRWRLAASSGAGEGDTPAPAADLKEGIERLIGKRVGRVVNRVIFAVVALVVLFLVGILGYVLYIVLSEAL
jgi:hypothetical protein